MNNLKSDFNPLRRMQFLFECSFEHDPTLRMIYNELKEYALELVKEYCLKAPSFDGAIIPDMVLFLEDSNETEKN